ncbi:hypothetical protein QTP86_029106 [Hemibagrus guttatus]|nr:hypothetical protein QTP86_029106 [Hemibagrus guttatus]
MQVFTDPVTIPCKHNFCKSCLTQYWEKCQHYPVRKEKFTKRPELINTTLRPVADIFKKKSGPDKLEVLCDSCFGEKMKALKSCLDCRVTLCKTHLGPHNNMPKLKKHKLINPVENLEDYICQKHERPLELFCRDDQMCVCQFCTETDHKNHNTVYIEEGSRERKTQLGKTQTDVQKMIQDRMKKIQEIKHSVELSKRSTEKEKADSVEVFTALIRSIERSQAELLEVMEQKQKAAERQAEGLIKELEQEITVLKRRYTEPEQLSNTEEHLHLLQIYSSMCSPPHTKNWTEISINTNLIEDTLSQLNEKIAKSLNDKLKETISKELKRIRQYAVDVTLDPDTAHPKLTLSADRKQVTHGDTRQTLSDTPERFDICPGVLAKQSFSSGRFYYEVQVRGKTEWTFGVSRQAINRKGGITLTPEKGFWTLTLRNENQYKACASPSVPLTLTEKVEKVGVFVDYEEGVVSFYDVEAKSCIYSFTAQSFTEKLYPFLSPSTNKIDSSMCSPPHTKNWTEISINTYLSGDTVRTALSQLQQTLNKKITKTLVDNLKEIVSCDSSSLLSEEQLQCSICLDVFTDPVTTSCGHNFCKSCITQCWEKRQHYHCPLCNEQFSKKPELKINTTLREVADHFKKKCGSDKPEVLCDSCTGEKLKALKSCLDCGLTFCKTHLDPHNHVSKLQKHKLINPVENLEDYICQKHERPLELFCRDDQTCVCQFCTETDHKNHNTVPIEEESREKKTQLVKTHTDVQQMIQDRVKKIKEIKHSVELSKRSTEKEKTDSVEVFTALIRSIKRSQAELLKLMEEKQKAAERQAEGLIKELEQEITVLKRRDTELEQLSHTEEHLHLLQIYSSMCSPPHTKNWTEISINTDLSGDTVRTALSQLQQTLNKKVTKTLNDKLKETVSTELKRIQQYAVDVTLDPDTAHPYLILSADGKQLFPR